MAAPKLNMVLEQNGIRVTVCPCDPGGQCEGDPAGAVMAIDWQMWLRVAACVASCLSATPAPKAAAEPGSPPAAVAGPGKK